MRWIVSNTFALALVATTAAACGTPAEPEEPCLGEPFDLKSNAEPLGSGKRLKDEFSDAIARKIATVTLGEMTTKAGWTGEWDRAVQVSARTTVDRFNEKAGTHLAANCLVGRPFVMMSNDSAPLPYLVTVFIRNGEPVQTVDWADYLPELDRIDPFVTPDSELTYRGNSYWASTE